MAHDWVLPTRGTTACKAKIPFRELEEGAFLQCVSKYATGYYGICCTEVEYCHIRMSDHHDIFESYIGQINVLFSSEFQLSLVNSIALSYPRVESNNFRA